MPSRTTKTAKERRRGGFSSDLGSNFRELEQKAQNMARGSCPGKNLLVLKGGSRRRPISAVEELAGSLRPLDLEGDRRNSGGQAWGRNMSTTIAAAAARSLRGLVVSSLV